MPEKDLDQWHDLKQVFDAADPPTIHRHSSARPMAHLSAQYERLPKRSTRLDLGSGNHTVHELSII